MTSAISSIGVVPDPGISLSSNGGPSAGVDALLAKYQAQLADWEHCPSHTTPEGKAKIKELQTKVDELKQQQKSADARRSAQRQGARASAPVSATAPANNAAPSTAATSAAPSAPPDSPLGGTVDVFI
jgi:peptidoglycan hydrolase CwlO-like protein